MQAGIEPMEQPVEGQPEGQPVENAGGEGASQASIDMEKYIDRKTYSDLEGRYKELEVNSKRNDAYWQAVDNAYRTDPDARKLLNKVFGIPELGQSRAATPTSSAAKPTQAQQADPAFMRELEETRREVAQIRYQAQLEKNERVVSNEWDGVVQAMNISDEDNKEFWNRWQQIVNDEFQNNARMGMAPKAAWDSAVRNHSGNLRSEYIALMEDKVGEYFAQRNQQRQPNFRGVQTKADRLRTGSTPAVKQRLEKIIQESESTEERAQARLQLAREMGVDPKELFAGPQR